MSELTRSAASSRYGQHPRHRRDGATVRDVPCPTQATPSAFATNPMGMAQILLFIGLTEGYTFPEGAWSGDMKREPGDLGYRVMRSADVMVNSVWTSHEVFTWSPRRDAASTPSM